MQSRQFYSNYIHYWTLKYIACQFRYLLISLILKNKLGFDSDFSRKRKRRAMLKSPMRDYNLNFFFVYILAKFRLRKIYFHFQDMTLGKHPV